MTILSAQSIRRVKPIEPFCERTVLAGMSYGLSAAGYDIRIREGLMLSVGSFKLASTIERFKMPNDVLGHVADKSTWARRGLAVQNTIIEPGWEGYLTLELTNHGPDYIFIRDGSPIAQVIFHWLDTQTDQPYSGKYQHQPARPVGAITEYGSEHDPNGDGFGHPPR